MATETMTLEQLQQECDNYEMPRPAAGDIVRFFPNCNRGDHNETIGIVQRVRQRAIVLIVPEVGVTRRFEVVRHVDDPKFRLMPDIKSESEGAWDFRDADLQAKGHDSSQLLARIDQLEMSLANAEKVISSLAARLDALESPPKRLASK